MKKDILKSLIDKTQPHTDDPIEREQFKINSALLQSLVDIIEPDTIEEYNELTRPGTGYLTSALPFEIGKRYFIRTVTGNQHTGQLREICGDKFLILENTHQLPGENENKFKEFIGEAYINIQTITEAYPEE